MLATELLNKSNTEIIKIVGTMCYNDMVKSGVLASVTLAQFILESAYGKSELAQNANNLFGMKTKLSGNTWTSVWDGKSKYAKETWENVNGKDITVVADFRKYPAIEDSIADHSLYLLGAMNGKKLRYPGIQGVTDYKKVAQLIKDGGYATDPNYVSKLCNIIETNHLTEYDKEITMSKVKIAHAVQSESGTTTGKVGDQTGNEVCIAEWYMQNANPWTYALRPKSEAFANRIVKCATSLANNKHVGYSQQYDNQIYTIGRLSLEARLREINWKYSDLVADCNCDCSTFVKAVHNSTVTKDTLRLPLDRDFDTANAKGELLSTNCYIDISDDEHLLRTEQLRKGDVVGRKGHIFIVLEDGHPDYVDVCVTVAYENAENFIEAMRLLGYEAK